MLHSTRPIPEIQIAVLSAPVHQPAFHPAHDIYCNSSWCAATEASPSVSSPIYAIESVIKVDGAAGHT